MHGAAFGGEGEQGDARADVKQLPGELGGGDGDIGELFRGWFRNDAAIGHKEHAVFAELRILHFQDLATRSGGALRRNFHDLK